MGQSKSTEKKKAVVDSSNNVKEVSTGTHFIEIHVPTAGFGVGSLLLLVGLLYLLYRCRRSIKKNKEKRQEAKEMRATRMLALLGGYDDGDRLAWLEQGPGFMRRPSQFNPWSPRFSRSFSDNSRFEELGETTTPRRVQTRGLKAPDLRATDGQDATRTSSRPAMADLDA